MGCVSVHLKNFNIFLSTCFRLAKTKADSESNSSEDERAPISGKGRRRSLRIAVMTASIWFVLCRREYSEF